MGSWHEGRHPSSIYLILYRWSISILRNPLSRLDGKLRRISSFIRGKLRHPVEAPLEDDLTLTSLSLFSWSKASISSTIGWLRRIVKLETAAYVRFRQGYRGSTCLPIGYFRGGTLSENTYPRDDMGCGFRYRGRAPSFSILG